MQCEEGQIKLDLESNIKSFMSHTIRPKSHLEFTNLSKVYFGIILKCPKIFEISVAKYWLFYFELIYSVWPHRDTLVFLAFFQKF